MGRNEFIDKLRLALNGRIAPAQVEDNINYYRDYIQSEMNRGKSESEVMDMLGDPRLIARTIIDTSTPLDEREDKGAYSEEYYQNADSQQRQSRREYSGYEDHRKTQSKGFRMPGWLFWIIFILVVALILTLIFSVLAFLAPFIIVMLAVTFLVKLFRDWLN